MKESVVEIKDGRYRYAYDPTTKATKYLGPLGDSPPLSEADFLRMGVRKIPVWALMDFKASGQWVKSHVNIQIWEADTSAPPDPAGIKEMTDLMAMNLRKSVRDRTDFDFDYEIRIEDGEYQWDSDVEDDEEMGKRVEKGTITGTFHVYENNQRIGSGNFYNETIDEYIRVLDFNMREVKL